MGLGTIEFKGFSVFEGDGAAAFGFVDFDVFKADGARIFDFDSCVLVDFEFFDCTGILSQIKFETIEMKLDR